MFVYVLSWCCGREEEEMRCEEVRSNSKVMRKGSGKRQKRGF